MISLKHIACLAILLSGILSHTAQADPSLAVRCDVYRRDDRVFDREDVLYIRFSITNEGRQPAKIRTPEPYDLELLYSSSAESIRWLFFKDYREGSGLRGSFGDSFIELQPGQSVHTYLLRPLDFYFDVAPEFWEAVEEENEVALRSAYPLTPYSQVEQGATVVTLRPRPVFFPIVPMKEHDQNIWDEMWKRHDEDAPFSALVIFGFTRAGEPLQLSHEALGELRGKFKSPHKNDAVEFAWLVEEIELAPDDEARRVPEEKLLAWLSQLPDVKRQVLTEVAREATANDRTLEFAKRLNKIIEANRFSQPEPNRDVKDLDP